MAADDGEHGAVQGEPSAATGFGGVAVGGGDGGGEAGAVVFDDEVESVLPVGVDVEGERPVWEAAVFGGVADHFAGGIKDDLGREGGDLVGLGFDCGGNVPTDLVKGVGEFVVDRFFERTNEAEAGDCFTGRVGDLTQEVRDLFVGIGEEFDCFLLAVAVVRSGKGKHGGVELGEHIVMENAAGLLVDDLALDHLLPLEADEPSRQFCAGLGVHEPLAAGAGDLDFFLGVEIAIDFVADEEEADEATLAPEGNRPCSSAVVGRVEGEAGGIWGGEVGGEGLAGGKRPFGWIGERGVDEGSESAHGREIADLCAQHIAAEGGEWLGDIHF